MKTIFTTILLAGFQFAFAQITVHSTDMPVPTEAYRLFYTPAPTLQNDFFNKVWDYTNITPEEEFTISFFKEEIPVFVSAGIDVYRTVIKNFNADFGYYTDIEIDFNENAVQEKGMYVEEQRYGLGSFTGNNNDSLNIPGQAYLYNSTIDVIKFPFTYQSIWSSVARRSVDFTLTVNAYFLNKIPAKHVWYSFRRDTIIGYGKMSVYTEQGASKSYDVLVDRVESFSVDSFYLSGQPAPAALLNAFSVQQGQVTNIGNRINFYRKGLFWYLASFYYGTLPFDQQPNALFICDNDTELATSSDDIDKAHFTMTMYPTLLKASENLHIYFSDQNKINGVYQIYDINGRVMTHGKLNSDVNYNTVEIPHYLSTGQYVISFQDNKGAFKFSEKFIVH